MRLYGSPDCYSVSRTFCHSHVSGPEIERPPNTAHLPAAQRPNIRNISGSP
jgi:hypothetical protein